MSHRPRFRSIAALAMTAMAIVGVAAVALAVWVGLRDAAIMLNFAHPLVLDGAAASRPLGSLARLWMALTRHTLLPLATVSIVMLSMAYLLRRIVLHGLRD